MLELKEKQNIEFKASWRDEYLKWICGFANADGGKIYIGADDNGQIVGIQNSKKLLEDIPNKAKDILGIMVDVNLHNEGQKEYLEIIVEPYPYPVSYKGQYHYRSGSSKQELKGAALDKFLLAKQGKKWDGVPVPYVGIKDLDVGAMELFKQKALKKKRIDTALLDEKDDVLIEKLHLKDGDYLKRASLLLFCKDTEKYITGSYIKIGYFKTDSDLIFQDKIDGNLFEQVDKTMDLIFTKYLKAAISYEGIQRVESFPVSQLAFREALINAVVHKDYGSLNPIQISVYDEKLLIWNSGELPLNWTIETLKHKHPSEPFNPAIANVFFLAGFIESWGRGIEKIISESRAFNGIAPNFRFDNGLWVEFDFNQLGEKVGENLGENLGDKLGIKLTKNRQSILEKIKLNSYITIEELSKKIGISTTAVENNIAYLKENNVLKRVGSAKGGHWQIIDQQSGE